MYRFIPGPSTTIISLGLVLMIAGFVGLPAPVNAQQWFIPQRPNVLQGGRLELGSRLQYRTQDLGRVRRQILEVVPNVRYAPVGGFEFYGELPMGLGDRSLDNIGVSARTGSDAGLGDFFGQISVTLAGGPDWRVLGSLDGTIPTGTNSVEDEVGIGSGFYRVSPGVRALKVIDPVVLFGFVGYEHVFEETFNSRSPPPSTLEIQPGEALRFRMGLGLQMTPRVRFNFYTANDIRSKTEFNGSDVPGSESEEVRLGSGVDWQIGSRWSLEFNAVFGLTNETSDAVLTSGFSYQL